MTDKESKRWNKIVNRQYIFSDSDDDNSESSDDSSDEPESMDSTSNNTPNGVQPKVTNGVLPIAKPSNPPNGRKSGIFGLTDKKRPIGSIMSGPPTKKLKSSKDAASTSNNTCKFFC